MPSPYIGAFEMFATEWAKAPPFAHSKPYRQPDVNGNHHVVGPVYADSSTLRGTVFIANRILEKATLQAAAALCGQAFTVSEVTPAGNVIEHEDVFIESVRLVKSSAAVGHFDGSEWVMVLEFTVYLPEDWS